MKNRASKETSIRRRLKSFGHAINGIVKTIINEPSFRIHLAVMLMVVVLSLFMGLSTMEWMLIIFCFGFVLSAEIFNSSIEGLTDMVSPGHNPKAGLVKDMAAGAVLVSAITAAIVGLIIFVPKLLKYL